MGVRHATRFLDAVLRKLHRIIPAGDEADCLLRLQIARAKRPIRAGGLSVERGEPVLLLHLWNERLPGQPGPGPDFHWAVRAEHLFRASLRVVARRMETDSRLAGVRAVGGSTGLFAPGETGGAGILRRLGFEVGPPGVAPTRLGAWGQDLHARLMRRAYGAPGLRRLPAARGRTEFWMAASDFIARFGDVKTGLGKYPD